MAPQRMLFNAFVLGSPNHQVAGMWRHPKSAALGHVDIEYWKNLTRMLEDAAFDCLFFADIIGMLEDSNEQGGWDDQISGGHEFPAADVQAICLALSSVTTNLGLVYTGSVVSDHPFAFARRVATHDHLSNGRVGWNIVTSVGGFRNFSHKEMTPHDQRYVWAEEYVDVIFKLLEGSWDDDALVCDKKAGVYADPRHVHAIDHVGQRYSVQGPHLVSPSPQRVPVLFQAGQSKAGREFAARFAEGQFIHCKTPADAEPIISDVRSTAVAYGRLGSDIKFFIGKAFIVGETMAEAEAKAQELRSSIDLDTVAAYARGMIGVDLRGMEPDAPVSFKASQGFVGDWESIVKKTTDGVVTVRHVLEYMSGADYDIVGTPASIADELEQWQAAGVDGVNVANYLIPGSYEDFIELVVPELQRRGLMQTEYQAGTLREKLFGAGPRLDERHPAAKYRNYFG